ncbi:hypothetical protein TRFO_43312 [Tritrichomonas foetus]|uniref:Uncharacterized protein n=1 Tax=Tritrichomonas foetus TaxID=1144522 RepID=A0A1J4KRD0_9EUKA|nr:hypothetical protein TRFO_43312 [Tritrichomonas foetus]|eukprot:OHT13488.1 hypothetical protein TRFO_43312 [Tritrichomonas foetus]
MSFLADLNQFETFVTSYQTSNALSQDIEAAIADIVDYNPKVWKDFNEEYFVVTRKFFPFQVPQRRKITLTAARRQLQDFVTLHPVFRAATMSKIMTKLINFFVPEDKKTEICQMIYYAYEGMSNSELPMTDDEEPPRRNKPISYTKAPMLEYKE